MSSNYGSAPPPGNYSTPYSNYGATEQHEMQNLPQASSSPVNVLGQQEFLSRIGQLRKEVRTLSTDVQQISLLHQAALNGNDDSAQRRLDELVAATQHKNNNIRAQLRTLKADVEATPLSASGASTKKQQWEVLNRDFRKELQGYLEEEQSFKERYRQQIARQYRIVNPDAPEDEVRQAAERDWSDEGVFQSALSYGRTGQANAVLGNVRARHNELLDIERSINELVMMIQDLDTIIIQQEPQVAATEEQVNTTVGHLEEGNKQIDLANEKARHRRKLKWICSGIVLLIIIAIGLGVGLGVGLAARNTGGGGSSNNNSNGNSTRRSVDDPELVPAANMQVTKLPVVKLPLISDGVALDL
ncbi:unnamed protein product [Discula destructiva]